MYLVDKDGSSRYRLLYPALAMKAKGFDIEVCEAGIETRDCDVIVMNRPVRESQAQCIEELASAEKRIVVDLDDWYDKIIKEHTAYSLKDAASLNIHRACKAASTVTVTTPALLHPYGYGKGEVFPNYVPEWYLDVKPAVEHEKPWVMWTGTLATHPTDLQTTKGNVAKAMREQDAELAYIGPKDQGKYVKFVLKWDGVVQLTGWFDEQKLLMEAMASADIGIVPLADTSFNTAKSWIKMAEFAAVGVPVIGGPTVENWKLHKLGVGLIAKYPRDWYFHTKALLASKDLREEVAGRGREAMQKLTYEGHAEEIFKIWAGPTA